jgi:hypothetical protein
MSKISLFHKSVFVKDLVIALIIIALPFLYYTYRYFPTTQVWEGFFFTIDSGDFEEVYFFMWLVNIKLYIIVLLSVWLITCKHWWRYAILVPLIIELFKLSGLLNSENTFFDEIDFINSLPITIPVILFVLFLSKLMNHYSKFQDINTELVDEIDTIFIEINAYNNDAIYKIKEEFKELKSTKNTTDKASYLNEILILRRKILKINLDS